MISQSQYQSFIVMTVPKLSSNNFEDLDLDFQGAARSKVGLSGIPFD